MFKNFAIPLFFAKKILPLINGLADKRSPRSPLSGFLYRDVIWGTESLYPIQIQCNIAKIYGGLAP